jgi:hypothetical protein
MAAILSNPVVQAQIGADVVAGLLAGKANLAYRSPAILVGTGAGKVDRIYVATLAVTTGAPQDIDLTAVVDPSGVSIAFAFVTHIVLWNLSTTAGQDFTLGGAASNPIFAAIPTVARANGGIIMIGDPNPGITVDGTHKNLRVAVAAGTAVAASLLVMGRSA